MPEDWPARVEQGAWLIVEGDSPPAASLGFRVSGGALRVAAVCEERAPEIDIVWERPLSLPRFEAPAHATVFTRERRSGAPLVAGYRKGAGGVLWTAVSPGNDGCERFPFLLQALGDLGLRPPFRCNRLWAFFDHSYRLRADSDYLARRWSEAGIRGLHVAAWHFHEPDRARDAYLRGLIESCHRRGILVFAWLELPHVSEQFWRDHPDWREQTAARQDAQLDWRMLMNLANPDCFRAAAEGIGAMLGRFDWDGVNLAELYFESLQGYDNPNRFTPFNADVRREFRAAHGFDPLDLFDRSSPRHFSRDAAGLRQFLEYRAGLAHRFQAQWLEWLDRFRAGRPGLALVLTHIDDQFDRRMRDALGADARTALPLAARHRLTFLVEDPATVWNLGAERYSEIARRYSRLAPDNARLAVDLNIVERYQDVYPTRQQTGTELFRLVCRASRAFPRVALYSEHSIQAFDVPWLSSAAAAAQSWRNTDGRLTVESRFGAGVRWRGPALVNGRLWPAADDDTVWLPAGRHRVEPAPRQAAIRLMDLSGDLLSAEAHATGMRVGYRSDGRALALVDQFPQRLTLDGRTYHTAVQPVGHLYLLRLPAGQHDLRVHVKF